MFEMLGTFITQIGGPIFIFICLVIIVFISKSFKNSLLRWNKK